MRIPTPRHHPHASRILKLNYRPAPRIGLRCQDGRGRSYCPSVADIVSVAYLVGDDVLGCLLQGAGGDEPGAAQAGRRPQCPDSAGPARSSRLGFTGWANPHPIHVSLDADDLSALRRQIRRDVALLRPRCRALDAALPAELRVHRGYVASRREHAGSVVLEDLPDPPVAPRRDSRGPLPLPLENAPAAQGVVGLAAMLHANAGLVAVGAAFGPDMRGLMAERATTQVAPGRASAGDDPRRPMRASLPGWLAYTDEVDRAAVGAILLGRDTDRVDVELLRNRLHGHHRLMVEPGAAALPWLFGLWDGRVSRHGEILVFSEPGARFREPSRAVDADAGIAWPRISVVTVSFNQCQYLEQCLDSVLDQAYPNLEYIVVDGGSTDGSVDILERYRSRLTRLVIEPDNGQSDGLNKGLGHATGEIVTWVNSDDMLAPLALRRAAQAFVRSGADIVAGTCSRVSGVAGDLLYRHHSVLPLDRTVPLELRDVINWSGAWEKGDYFFQPEVFFTRDIWLRAGGYLKPYLYWAMDWDLWLRCALAGARAVRIPDVLGISREHVEQKTRGDEMYLWQVLNLLREYDRLLAELEVAKP